MFARLLALKIFAAILLAGCAQTHKPANVPSSAVVRGNIQEAQRHIHAASAAVKAAGADNTELQSLSERMDHKAVIIDRWLETQP